MNKQCDVCGIEYESEEQPTNTPHLSLCGLECKARDGRV